MTRLLPHVTIAPNLAWSGHNPTGDERNKLGSPGRCSGHESLQIWIFDDSGSVTSAGGSDPLSRRYHEARTALSRVARACSCGKERVGVLHFDTGFQQVQPSPLTTAGERRVRGGLQRPAGDTGSSDLLPALEVAEGWADRATSDSLIQLMVFSDFELTDAEPLSVIARMEAFPGEVTAVVLGCGAWPGSDPSVRVQQVSSGDRVGAFAKTVFTGLVRHRVGSGA